MKIMGVRSSSSEIRYAVLEKDIDSNIIFQNRISENRLVYPAGIEELQDKLKWVKDEFNRIFRQNNDIEKIILKMNEYVGTDNGAKRETTYMDAIIMLVAAENNIPIERRLYSQIGATSKHVKNRAESIVGCTEKYWNDKMADAIQCAAWELRRK